MTRQEIIDVFKTELSKTYTIRTTQYEDGIKVRTKEEAYPNALLSFNRDVIEAALKVLEEQYDI